MVTDEEQREATDGKEVQVEAADLGQVHLQTHLVGKLPSNIEIKSEPKILESIEGLVKTPEDQVLVEAPSRVEIHPEDNHNGITPALNGDTSKEKISNEQLHKNKENDEEPAEDLTDGIILPDTDENSKNEEQATTDSLTENDQKNLEGDIVDDKLVQEDDTLKDENAVEQTVSAQQGQNLESAKASEDTKPASGVNIPEDEVGGEASAKFQVPPEHDIDGSDTLPGCTDEDREMDGAAQADNAVHLNHKENFPEDMDTAEHRGEMVEIEDQHNVQADLTDADTVQEETPKSKHAGESTVDILNQESAEEINDTVNVKTDKTPHQSNTPAADDETGTLEDDVTTREQAFDTEQVQSQGSAEEIKDIEAVETEEKMHQSSTAISEEAISGGDVTTQETSSDIQHIQNVESEEEIKSPRDVKTEEISNQRSGAFSEDTAKENNVLPGEPTVDIQPVQELEPEEIKNIESVGIDETAHQRHGADIQDLPHDDDIAESEPVVMELEEEVKDIEAAEPTATLHEASTEDNSTASEPHNDIQQALEQESIQIKDIEATEPQAVSQQRIVSTSEEATAEDNVTAEAATCDTQEVQSVESAEAKDNEAVKIEDISDKSNFATAEEAYQENDVLRSEPVAAIQQPVQVLEPEDTKNTKHVEAEEVSHQRHVDPAQEDSATVSEIQTAGSEEVVKDLEAIDDNVANNEPHVGTQKVPEQESVEIKDVDATEYQGVSPQNDVPTSEEPTPEDNLTAGKPTCNNQEVQNVELEEEIKENNEGAKTEESKVLATEPTADTQPVQKPESEETKNTDPVEVDEISHQRHVDVEFTEPQGISEQSSISTSDEPTPEDNATPKEPDYGIQEVKIAESVVVKDNKDVISQKLSNESTEADAQADQENNVLESEPTNDIQLVQDLETEETKSTEAVGTETSHHRRTAHFKDPTQEDNITASEPQMMELSEEIKGIQATPEAIPHQTNVASFKELDEEDDVTTEPHVGIQQVQVQESVEFKDIETIEPRGISQQSIVSTSKSTPEDDETTIKPSPDTQIQNVESAEAIKGHEDVNRNVAIAEEANEPTVDTPPVQELEPEEIKNPVEMEGIFHQRDVPAFDPTEEDNIAVTELSAEEDNEALKPEAIPHEINVASIKELAVDDNVTASAPHVGIQEAIEQESVEEIKDISDKEPQGIPQQRIASTSEELTPEESITAEESTCDTQLQDVKSAQEIKDNEDVKAAASSDQSTIAPSEEEAQNPQIERSEPTSDVQQVQQLGSTEETSSTGAVKTEDSYQASKVATLEERAPEDNLIESEPYADGQQLQEQESAEEVKNIGTMDTKEIPQQSNIVTSEEAAEEISALASDPAFDVPQAQQLESAKNSKDNKAVKTEETSGESTIATMENPTAEDNIVTEIESPVDIKQVQELESVEEITYIEAPETEGAYHTSQVGTFEELAPESNNITTSEPTFDIQQVNDLEATEETKDIEAVNTEEISSQQTEIATSEEPSSNDNGTTLETDVTARDMASAEEYDHPVESNAENLGGEIDNVKLVEGKSQEEILGSAEQKEEQVKVADLGSVHVPNLTEEEVLPDAGRISSDIDINKDTTKTFDSSIEATSTSDITVLAETTFKTPSELKPDDDDTSLHEKSSHEQLQKNSKKDEEPVEALPDDQTLPATNDEGKANEKAAIEDTNSHSQDTSTEDTEFPKYENKILKEEDQRVANGNVISNKTVMEEIPKSDPDAEPTSDNPQLHVPESANATNNSIVEKTEDTSDERNLQEDDESKISERIEEDLHEVEVSKTPSTSFVLESKEDKPQGEEEIKTNSDKEEITRLGSNDQTQDDVLSDPAKEDQHKAETCKEPFDRSALENISEAPSQEMQTEVKQEETTTALPSESEEGTMQEPEAVDLPAVDDTAYQEQEQQQTPTSTVTHIYKEKEEVKCDEPVGVEKLVEDHTEAMVYHAKGITTEVESGDLEGKEQHEDGDADIVASKGIDVRGVQDVEGIAVLTTGNPVAQERGITVSDVSVTPIQSAVISAEDTRQAANIAGNENAGVDETRHEDTTEHQLETPIIKTKPDEEISEKEVQPNQVEGASESTISGNPNENIDWNQDVPTDLGENTVVATHKSESTTDDDGEHLPAQISGEDTIETSSSIDQLKEEPEAEIIERDSIQVPSEQSEEKAIHLQDINTTEEIHTERSSAGAARDSFESDPQAAQDFRENHETEKSDEQTSDQDSEQLHDVVLQTPICERSLDALAVGQPDETAQKVNLDQRQKEDEEIEKQKEELQIDEQKPDDKTAICTTKPQAEPQSTKTDATNRSSEDIYEFEPEPKETVVTEMLNNEQTVYIAQESSPSITHGKVDSIAETNGDNGANNAASAANVEKYNEGEQENKQKDTAVDEASTHEKDETTDGIENEEVNIVEKNIDYIDVQGPSKIQAEAGLTSSLKQDLQVISDPSPPKDQALEKEVAHDISFIAASQNDKVEALRVEEDGTGKINADLHVFQASAEQVIYDVEEKQKLHSGHNEEINNERSENIAFEIKPEELSSNEPWQVVTDSIGVAENTPVDDAITSSVETTCEKSSIQPRGIEEIGESKESILVSECGAESSTLQTNVEQDLSIHHELSLVEDEKSVSTENDGAAIEMKQQKVDPSNDETNQNAALSTNKPVPEHEMETASEVNETKQNQEAVTVGGIIHQGEAAEKPFDKIGEADTSETMERSNAGAVEPVTFNEDICDKASVTDEASSDKDIKSYEHISRNLDVSSAVTASNGESKNEAMEDHSVALPGYPTQNETSTIDKTVGSEQTESELSLSEKPLPTEPKEQEEKQVSREPEEEAMHKAVIDSTQSKDQKVEQGDLPVSRFLMNLILQEESSDPDKNLEAESEKKQEETTEDNSHLNICKQDENLVPFPTEEQDVKGSEETHDTVKEQTQASDLDTEISLEIEELEKNKTHDSEVPACQENLQNKLSSELTPEEAVDLVSKMEAQDTEVPKLQLDNNAVDTNGQENIEAATLTEKGSSESNPDDSIYVKASEEDTLDEGKGILQESLLENRNFDPVFEEQTILLAEPNAKDLPNDTDSVQNAPCEKQEESIGSSNAKTKNLEETLDIQPESEEVNKEEEKHKTTGGATEDQVQNLHDSSPKGTSSEATSDNQTLEITEPVSGSEKYLPHEKEISAISTHMDANKSSNIGVGHFEGALEGQSDSSNIESNQDKQDEASDNQIAMDKNLHEEPREFNLQEHQETDIAQKSPDETVEGDEQFLLIRKPVITEENVHSTVESHGQTVKKNSAEEQEVSDSQVQKHDLEVALPKDTHEVEESFVEITRPEVSTDEEQSPKADKSHIAEEKIDDETNKRDEEGTKNFTDDAILKTEARGAGQKATHKKHNILSGVGSKVKHQLAKVKKAIIGKPGHPKSEAQK